MCTDKSLFCFENYKLLLQEIDSFLTEHIEHKFTSVNPPKLFFSTRSKHDYIIYKNKMAGSTDLSLESDNCFIPKYIPRDLKWYERDGLDTWYLKNKCDEFLEDTDLHFAKCKIVNFDMIKNNVPKNIQKQYQTVGHEEIRLDIKSKFARLYTEMPKERYAYRTENY